MIIILLFVTSSRRGMVGRSVFLPRNRHPQLHTWGVSCPVCLSSQTAVGRTGPHYM